MYSDVLRFWFEESSPKQWFSKDESFDKKIVEQFTNTFRMATIGELDEWKNEASSCLALVIVLDQFPRNMFRDDKRAFEQDDKALAVTKFALEKDYDKQLTGPKKSFLIMPLMHSETLADQELCVELFSSWGEGYGENLKFAKEHRDIIARFGRFPHRNKVLGRENTAEEEEFLKTHSGF